MAPTPLHLAVSQVAGSKSALVLSSNAIKGLIFSSFRNSLSYLMNSSIPIQGNEVDGSSNLQGRLVSIIGTWFPGETDFRKLFQNPVVGCCRVFDANHRDLNLSTLYQ